MHVSLKSITVAVFLAASALSAITVSGACPPKESSDDAKTSVRTSRTPAKTADYAGRFKGLSPVNRHFNRIAPPRRREAIRDSLFRALPKARTAKDSLRIYYNIFDLTSGAANLNIIGDKIYQTAVSARDTTSMFEAIRLIVGNLPTGLAAYRDSVLSVQLQRAELLPASPEERETVTFIRIRQIRTKIADMDDEGRMSTLHELLATYDRDEHVDIYRRIEMLFTICSFLRDRNNSQLLLSYLRELGILVDKLPPYPGAIRSYYSVIAATSNSIAGHSQEAVNNDLKVIENIYNLEKKYSASGRIYRNYNTSYYTALLRMLGNSSVLTDKEIEEIHREILYLRDAEEVIAEDMDSNHLADAYYAMARKDYAAAVPLLQKALTVKTNKSRRFILLRMLVKAAQATGNGPVLLEAYQQYTPMLEARAMDQESDRIVEYEILHDMQSLEASNTALEASNTRMKQESDIMRESIIIVAVAVLIVLMAVFFVAYRRSRAMARRLRDTNRSLIAERDNLRRIRNKLIEARDAARIAEQQRGDFLTTVSHEISEPVNAIVGYSQLIVDTVDEKRRPALERFMKIIDLNSQIIRSLVNDVLDVAELEGTEVLVKRKRELMSYLANIAADPLRSRLLPGVTMTVEPLPGTPENLSVDTDPLRVEQVLNNIINNAVKFTDKGHILVQYGYYGKDRRAAFIVSDTGPGIPKEKHEVIFGRFEKLGHASQGIGLGLYICRLVAKILDAEVFIDSDYEGGTRLVFVLPKGCDSAEGLSRDID